ncbi:MAG: disulfide oxidoreductase, partial [Dongiaceae bacterium]
PGRVRARAADDHLALAALGRDDDVARRADNPAALRLLWEVCQIPDYRKTMTDAHTRLIGRVFGHLSGDAGGEGGRLPRDWVADQIARIDRADGDIDTLVARIAHIRTWTYISHRADWLDDPAHWQERARAIEDRLSDALHRCLTQRFVDHRHAVLARRMKAGGLLLGAVTRDGEVVVEGHRVGRLDGFRFTPDADAGGADARALMTAARRALAQEIPARLRRVEGDADDAFALTPAGLVTWHGVPVARLAAGDQPLLPRVEPLPSEFIEGPARERLRHRLALWLERWLRRRLAPLWRAREAALAGPARGLVFQLVEALGTLPRRAAAAQADALLPADRRRLAGLGLRIGTESIWLPALADRAAAALAGLLWAVHGGVEPPPPPAAAGAPVAQLRPRPGAAAGLLSGDRLPRPRRPGDSRRRPRAAGAGDAPACPPGAVPGHGAAARAGRLRRRASAGGARRPRLPPAPRRRRRRQLRAGAPARRRRPTGAAPGRGRIALRRAR